MRRTKIILLLSISGLSGFLYYAIQDEWLIVRKAPAYLVDFNHICTDTYQLHFREKDIWQHESVTLISKEKDPLEMLLFQLISAWIAEAKERNNIATHVAVQSVIISQDKQDMWVSLTDNLFSQEQALYHKHQLIDGLKKTIKQVGCSTRLMLLVKHKPMNDRDIDCSIFWSL